CARAELGCRCRTQRGGEEEEEEGVGWVVGVAFVGSFGASPFAAATSPRPRRRSVADAGPGPPPPRPVADDGRLAAAPTDRAGRRERDARGRAVRRRGRAPGARRRPLRARQVHLLPPRAPRGA